MFPTIKNTLLLINEGNIGANQEFYSVVKLNVNSVRYLSVIPTNLHKQIYDIFRSRLSQII